MTCAETRYAWAGGRCLGLAIYGRAWEDAKGARLEVAPL